ncbi:MULTISPECIES: YiiD C-terminal domain-containing protein, partial [unclassified Sulfurospirillum]|uniref:YiiD C-terminal domain-containing protein n=1 Tax=unclassified Sulfurospirillum TaxID=2618290 RepID=UPI00056213B1
MNVLEIPFVQKVGLARTQDGHLVLPVDKSNENHIQTVHASAQFTLAETLSGEALQKMFPHLDGNVVPILRESEIKFKKPATGVIYGLTHIDDTMREKFEEQLAKKGRASISVEVEI